MTTFDQALANLQNSNNQRAAEAKGFNNDVARFQTQRANDTARLFMLAGELGKDISNRLAIRKEKEKKHEELYRLFKQKYIGNFEVDPKFKAEILQTELGQNQMSSILAQSINDNKLSPYVGTEGKNETGIGDRATIAAQLQSKSLEFTPWYYHQIRNNKGSFTAQVINNQGELVEKVININDSTLGRDEQYARLQYLTKQFLGQTASEYDPKFLTYDQKDGGSGYAASLMSQNDVIRKEIEKTLVSQSGIDDRKKAGFILYNTEEWNESTLQTALNLVLNSSNEEGTGIMRRDKAWKAFHKLIEDGLETGNIRREDLTTIANLEVLNLNGKKTLAEHRPDLYGDTDDAKGTMFKKADEYTTNLNAEVEKRNKAVRLEKMETLKKDITDGLTTWDSERATTLLLEFNREDPDFDYAEALNELKGIATPASIATAEKLWEEYQNKEIGEKRLLNDYLIGHPLEQALRNDDRIAAQLEIETNIETILKEDLKNLEIKVSQTTREQLGLTGKASWPDATTGSDYWKLVKAEAVHRYLESQNKQLGKSPQDIIKEIKDEIAAVPELDVLYKDHLIKRGKEKNEYGDYSSKDDEYAKQDWSLYDNSYHARDSDGVYYNVYKDSKLLSPTWYADSVKNKEKETLPNINLKDPTVKIPAEQKWITKYPAKNGEAVDWNEYVIKEGITSDINEICKAQNKSVLECIQDRAEASGQTLNEDVIEKLSGDVLTNVDPKTKNKIDNNKELTNGDNINITNSTNSAGIHNNLNGGEEGEQITNAISTWWCNECIDPTGKWKTGLEGYGKLNLGLGMGLLKSLSDTADRDLTQDGANSLFEATKDISKEELLQTVYNNPIAAFEAAKHSGDINYLPKEDFSILEDKKQTDYFKILDILGLSLDNTQGNPYTKD